MSLETEIRDIVRAELAQVLPQLTRPVTKEEYLTTKQVADLTGLSVSYFEVGRSMASPAHPPYHKIGRRVLYKRADVLSWIENRRRGER